jgi:hypothetical protein
MSLTGPVPKDVIEYFENHSFFFRDEIEREHSPLVNAPGYVAGLPEGLRKKFGVTKIQDKASGKMVWAWPGKMDYLAKAIPGTPNYVQQLATGGSDRRGKTTTGKVLSFLGVKAVPIDATHNAVNLAYARLDEIAKQKAKLNQQGFNAERPNVEYTKLLAQEKILRGITYQGKAKQGYKVLPKSGGPPKVRVKAPSSAPSTGRVLELGGSSSSGSSSGGGRVLNLGASSSSGSSSSSGGRVLSLPRRSLTANVIATHIAIAVIHAATCSALFTRRPYRKEVPVGKPDQTSPPMGYRHPQGTRHPTHRQERHRFGRLAKSGRRAHQQHRPLQLPEHDTEPARFG